MNPHARKGTAPSRRRVCRFRHSRNATVDNIVAKRESVNTLPAFTLLEVLVAVAIVGIAYGTFVLLSGRIVQTTDTLLKTALATVVANNAIDEVLYRGKTFSGEEVELLGYSFGVKQDFEDLMGFRILKVSVGTETTGEVVEIYEAR